ncbi:MAG: tRNA pseudouridine(55) synthase TruB, partial [Candidatus Sumerlaeota bacterium]|nr:tRNA pseudouridine(55) synthase TruB [Candidatus Sumerlaeota bacterium]
MKPPRPNPTPLLAAPAEGAVLLVDKPRGPTSHDVVNRLRRVFGLKRIGHAGTLDPMATGLLIMALGPATRLLQFLAGMDKEYEGEITFGAVSTTYDAEGEIRLVADAPTPPREAVERAMRRMEGEIEQRPPAYSAIKSQGRALYEYARRGEEVETPPRRVRIEEFRLADPQAAQAPPIWAPPRLRFACRVSSGTYVRSMAHDLGQTLGCGAYLSALRRTAIGPFRVESAVALETLEANPDSARAGLLRPAEALPQLPRIEIGGAAARRLEHGGAFTREDIIGRAGGGGGGGGGGQGELPPGPGVVAAVVEQCHDDKGIIWPVSVAPYQILILALNQDDPKIADTAQSLNDRLEGEGREV